MLFPFEDRSKGIVIFAVPFEATDDDCELLPGAGEGLAEHTRKVIRELSLCGGCWGSDHIYEGSESCSGIFYVVDPEGDCLISLVSATDGEQAKAFLRADEALGSPELDGVGRVYACIAYCYQDPFIEIGDFGREQSEDGDHFENLPTLARRLEASIEVYLRQPEDSGDPEVVFYASWDADGDLEEEDTFGCVFSAALTTVVPTAASCRLGVDDAGAPEEARIRNDDAGSDREGGHHADSDEHGVATVRDDELQPNVRAVLEGADAMEHAQMFREHQIGDDVLSSLTDADLVELGIQALGQRKRVLRAIAAIRGLPPSERPPTP